MFAKPKIIIYVRRNNIIVAGKDVSPAKLNIPPEILQNLEIVDPNAFFGSARDFFVARGVKGKRALIVLDDSVVFSKQSQCEKFDKSVLQQSLNSYIDSMPFEPGKRACLQIVDNNQIEHYATNAHIYESIVDALHEAGVGKVIAVTPTKAFKLDAAIQPAAAIERYLNDTGTQQIADFLAITPV